MKLKEKTSSPKYTLTLSHEELIELRLLTQCVSWDDSSAIGEFAEELSNQIDLLDVDADFGGRFVDEFAVMGSVDEFAVVGGVDEEEDL